MQIFRFLRISLERHDQSWSCGKMISLKVLGIPLQRGETGKKVTEGSARKYFEFKKRPLICSDHHDKSQPSGRKTFFDNFQTIPLQDDSSIFCRADLGASHKFCRASIGRSWASHIQLRPRFSLREIWPITEAWKKGLET